MKLGSTPLDQGRQRAEHLIIYRSNDFSSRVAVAGEPARARARQRPALGGSALLEGAAAALQ
jgi:hypothetical protein